jgi:hypothetical protein
MRRHEVGNAVSGPRNGYSPEQAPAQVSGCHLRLLLGFAVAGTVGECQFVSH